MRYFIALEIPEDCKKQLETVQTRLKELVPEVRLTKSEKLHLTIAFVGEESANLQCKLVEVMKKASLDIKPFSVTPAYLDAFPNLHEPHTFWIGVKGEIDKLMVLRERVKDGLIDLGIEVDERRYIPHIAIAKINHQFRLKPSVEAQLQKLMLSENFDLISISSLKLFESIPEEGFHRHNTLAEIPLG